MNNQVRLLPALIGAAAVLAVLRLGAMAVGSENALSGTVVASAAETATPPAPEAAAAASTTTAPAPAASAGTQTSPAAPAKPEEPKLACDTTAGQAQNKGEADVLHGLSDRRNELDARDNDLTLREQLLAATQKKVDEKIGELKSIQAKLDVMLATRDDAQKAQLGALVKMYENMKPSDAAKIFDKLDRHILVDVAGGMKPAKVGAVLAAMDTARAQELTALLATRLTLPDPQRVSASAATPSAISGATPTADQPSGAQPATAQPVGPSAAPAG
jgi:flagellar motility protein MotE (MotC chaperone)